MRVGGDVVGVGTRGGLFVHGLGEGDEEAVFADVDFFHLEGDAAAPINTLEGEGLGAADGPLAVGGETAGDELAFRRKIDVHDAGGESFAEWVTRTLPHAVHLLGRGAQDDALSVVAEEKLAVEWAEFAAGFVIDRNLLF